MQLKIRLALGICLLMLSVNINAEAANCKKSPIVTESPSQDAKSATTNGLFNVTRQDNDWFFDVADSLLNREFLVTVRYTATPANTGSYGGELANQQTVYWQKSPDGKLLLRSRLLVNTADTADFINRAVIISNADPIIGSFKVENRQGNASRIKVSNFFMEDSQAMGLNSYSKRKLGLQSLMGNLSYIESIHTFPLNTEVRLVKTWYSSGSNSYASALTGYVTLGLNISFLLLPKNPMMRRSFDPRVGYFTDDFTLFADNQQRVQTKRFITRWRLEPKDSADAEKMKRGELVEPKKQIVYYIDPATPKQWRPYLIAGVNDWQVAFEQAGFKNAIVAREWPENDSTMSMEDARFSVIRYLASPIENAYGPQVHDPRTGEILESHICWYHNVMTLVHDWYMIQAGTLDEAARCMKFDTNLMGQLIRFVSSHEVGHTLGLRHNFGSSSTVPVDSLRSKSFVEANGHTPSIMDYARFNYVAQPEDSISREGIFPRIGDYDKWAIQWGYTPTWKSYDDESDHWELEQLTSEKLKGNRRLWFGDGETNVTNDSRCQTEDLGDDAVKASMYGILNLKREIKQLPEWTYQSNDIFNENLQDAYNLILSQFLRYCFHVAGNIGGVYCDFKTVDEAGAVYTDTPKQKQLDAVRFLEQNVIDEPTWLTDVNYISRLVSSKKNVSFAIGTRVVAQLLSKPMINRLTDTYPAEEYIPEIVGYIFRTVQSSSASAYDKALQREAVGSLTEYIDTEYDKPSYGIVLQQLKKLQARCHSASGNAHCVGLADIIDRALVIK